MVGSRETSVDMVDRQVDRQVDGQTVVKVTVQPPEMMRFCLIVSWSASHCQKEKEKHLSGGRYFLQHNLLLLLSNKSSHAFHANANASYLIPAKFNHEINIYLEVGCSLFTPTCRGRNAKHFIILLQVNMLSVNLRFCRSRKQDFFLLIQHLLRV